jgi:hypothetical protein
MLTRWWGRGEGMVSASNAKTEEWKDGTCTHEENGHMVRNTEGAYRCYHHNLPFVHI